MLLPYHFTSFRLAVIVAATPFASLYASASEPTDCRGRQFIAVDSFAGFSSNSAPGEIVLTSPELKSKIHFNEVVVSWNTRSGEGSLAVEARARCGDKQTRYYQLGRWSSSVTDTNRHSVAGQKDDDGEVKTDTLVLARSAESVQVRVRLQNHPRPTPALKFLGISLADANANPGQLPPDRGAWGKVLPVPERTQMIYPNGNTLCSPTTVSMMLAFWAEKLKRPDLDRPVPEVASQVYDAEWKGAGNWPFNMAYAGSFNSLRAYVTRLSDVSEIEQWIERGIPVGLSVDYDRLRAKGPGPNGHLVVCVGFTESGQPIINDPGTSRNVRKVFPRENLVNAWACSKNTAYLVYPEGFELPADRFGHWDSALTRVPRTEPR